MSREDPKPGRWILPLVVAGIIGFTYTFVNALPAADVPTAAPTTTEATTSTSPSTTSSTTTTTLAPEVVAFVEAVDGFATRASDLVTNAQQINDDWDARTIDFAATREGLTQIRTDTDALVADLTGAELPEAAAAAWDDVISAAESMASAADDMFDGLVNTEGSEKRLNSLAAYVAAEASLQQAFEAATAAATG